MASVKGALGGAGTGASIGGMVGGPLGAGVGAGLGALLGLFTGGGDSSKPMSPELQNLYNLQLQREAQANPLIEAATRLAFSRLPVAARQGYAIPSYDEAYQSLGPMASGDYNEPDSVRSALRLMAARQKMADPLIQAVTRMAMSRLPPGVRPGIPTPVPRPSGEPGDTGRSILDARL